MKTLAALAAGFVAGMHYGYRYARWEATRPSEAWRKLADECQAGNMPYPYDADDLEALHRMGTSYRAS